MASRYVPNLMIWLLMISNTMLVLLVVVKLRETPSDVMVELRNAELNMHVAMDGFTAKQNAMERKINERQQWMGELTDGIKNWADHIGVERPELPIVPGASE